MSLLTRKTFIAGIDQLHNAYPRAVRLDKGQLDTWYQALCDLTESQFVDAVRLAIQEGDDWPTIAKLRKFAVSGGLRLEDRARRAWAILRHHTRHTGSYVGVDFDDPLMNATIRAEFGGWIEVCEMQTGDLDRCERKFVEMYCSIAATGCRHADAGPLPGLAHVLAARTGNGEAEVRRIETDMPRYGGLRLTGPRVESVLLTMGDTATRRLEHKPAEAVEQFGEVLDAKARLLELPARLKAQRTARQERERLEADAKSAQGRREFEALKRDAIERLREAGRQDEGATE